MDNRKNNQILNYIVQNREEKMLVFVAIVRLILFHRTINFVQKEIFYLPKVCAVLELCSQNIFLDFEAQIM